MKANHILVAILRTLSYKTLHKIHLVCGPDRQDNQTTSIQLLELHNI